MKKQNVLHNWGNIFYMATFLTVLPRAVFITQPKVYGGTFLQELLTTFSC